MQTSFILICGGAVIDFLANEVKRAPPLWRKMRMEWLYRLGQEPARLWRRYLLGIPIFIYRSLCLMIAKRVLESE